MRKAESNNTMNVYDISLMIKSLEYRALSLSDLALGIRSKGFRRHTSNHVEVSDNLRRAIEELADAEQNLAGKLRQAINQMEVQIDL